MKRITYEWEIVLNQLGVVAATLLAAGVFACFGAYLLAACLLISACVFYWTAIEVAALAADSVITNAAERWYYPHLLVRDVLALRREYKKEQKHV